MIALDALLNVGGKLIDKLIPDPEAKAKAQLELTKLAQDGELAKMANDIKLVELENANTDSARDMNAKVQESTNDGWPRTQPMRSTLASSRPPSSWLGLPS